VVNEPEQAQSVQGGEPVAALRLRSERPPVMRLSRKELTGLAGVAAITVSGALICQIASITPNGHAPWRKP
jgi:hypothetical protein